MTSSKGWHSSSKLFALIWLVFAPVVHFESTADPIKVAVATNFNTALEEIAEAYLQTTGNRIEVSAGSTGAIYAQITNGAPFDLFFAADSQRPAKLESSGRTLHRATYAIGQLAFWIPDGKAVSKSTLMAYNADIAIANPRHAPYGQAAIETIESLEMSPARIIRGSNVGQTFAFLETRNVTAGFVALSQLKHRNIDSASYWVVPAHYHQPIEQQYVVTRDANPAYADFLNFLGTTEVQQRLQTAGYLVSGGNQQ
jgi:molybdate transport system substrate-binding protein